MINPCMSAKEFYLKRLKDYDANFNFYDTITTNFPNASCINILSIGCGGNPVEYPALEEFFYPSKILFIGIDIEEEAIKECQETYAERVNAEFHVVDATNSKAIKKLFENQPVHIIVSRHPELYSSMEQLRQTVNIFEKIFISSIPKLLVPGGTLLVSNFLQEEKERLKEILPLITQRSYFELPQIENSLFTTIFEKTHLNDILHGLFYDKYFGGVNNFQPKLALGHNKKIDNKSSSFIVCQQIIIKFLYENLKINNNMTYPETFKILFFLFIAVIEKNKTCNSEIICQKISQALKDSIIDSNNIVRFNFELKWSEWSLRKYVDYPALWDYVIFKISKSVLQAALNSSSDSLEIFKNCQDALCLETTKPIRTKFFKPEMQSNIEEVKTDSFEERSPLT